MISSGVIAPALTSNAQANSNIATQELRLNGAGGVAIDATIYLPQTKPAPAILLAHGFTGDKKSVAPQAQELAAKGYVVLAWTERLKSSVIVHRMR